MDGEKKFALLIDADNISPKYLTVMLNEAKSYGTVSIRRIYGDWTDNAKKSWKDRLLESSLIPIQQYSYTTGKNASDSAMIIDAMDILYTNDVDGFIIVSSDSDFTRLAMRLREAGKFVVGMGESKTPSSFVRSCGEFKTLDVLFRNTLTEEEQKEELQSAPETAGREPEAEVPFAAPITPLRVVRRDISEIIDQNSDEEGKMLLSDLGRLLTRRHPDFDARNYGRYRKLSDFIRQLPSVRLEMLQTSGDKEAQAYVRNVSEKGGPAKVAGSDQTAKKARKKTVRAGRRRKN